MSKSWYLGKELRFRGSKTEFFRFYCPKLSLVLCTPFWVPRAAVERLVYHIESDVENKTSRSRRPSSLTWQDRLCPPPWERPPQTLPSGPQAGCCPRWGLQAGTLQGLEVAVDEVSRCSSRVWTVCVRLCVRFTVDCVGLTSGRPAVTCSPWDTLESLLFHFTTFNNCDFLITVCSLRPDVTVNPSLLW